MQSPNTPDRESVADSRERRANLDAVVESLGIARERLQMANDGMHWMDDERRRDSAESFLDSLTQGGGIKLDGGKPRFDLLSPIALTELSRVLEFGARKYADRNWENGMRWGRVFAAMMRHAWAFWRGERLDSESGMHHMACVMWGAMVLVHYDSHARYAEMDDRAKEDEVARAA